MVAQSGVKAQREKIDARDTVRRFDHCGVTAKSSYRLTLSVFDQRPTLPLTGSGSVYSRISFPLTKPSSLAPCTVIFIVCHSFILSGTSSGPRLTNLRAPLLKVQSTRLSSMPL